MYYTKSSCIFFEGYILAQENIVLITLKQVHTYPVIVLTMRV